MAENPNQELVGKEGTPATIHVDRARIRQFAKAVGLTDPIHYDEAEAKRQGHPGLVGPPTLPIALGQDCDPGEGIGDGPRVKWNVAKLLHEGTEIQFDRPIYAGDVLTMKSMLKSISTREGRSGVRTIYTMEQAFYDPSGKRVCALLLKTSEVSEMAVRFADVKVGDELPKYVHTKVTRTDLVKYAGASGDYNPMHHDEGIAKSAGMPSVFAHGMFSMGLLSNVIVNWAGAASVKLFDVQFRAITWPDETVTCTGKVAGKREEGGQKLVDVDLLCETKPGTKTIIGKATLALS